MLLKINSVEKRTYVYDILEILHASHFMAAGYPVGSFLELKYLLQNCVLVQKSSTECFKNG